MAFNQSCYGIRVKEECDQNFLYYLLKNEITTLKNNTHGSVFSTITKDTFKVIAVNLPPLEEQKAIADILSSLDDKIELNNQMNATLEEMAQALFKQWFVDFEFPNENGQPYKSSGGEMVDSELGEIPKGWEVDSLQGLVNTVITGKTPSTKIKENYGTEYPFITIPDMHNKTFVTKTERNLSNLGNNTQLNKLIPKNSINVSCIATVGLVTINAYPAHTNQQINSVICEEEEMYYFYEYFKLRVEELKAIGASGSTTLNVNKSQFEQVKYMYPTKYLLTKYQLRVKNIYTKICNNQKENETLAELRNSLLPKLMSGEIRVK